MYTDFSTRQGKHHFQCEFSHMEHIRPSALVHHHGHYFDSTRPRQQPAQPGNVAFTGHAFHDGAIFYRKIERRRLLQHIGARPGLPYTRDFTRYFFYARQQEATPKKRAISSASHEMRLEPARAIDSRAIRWLHPCEPICYHDEAQFLPATTDAARRRGHFNTVISAQAFTIAFSQTYRPRFGHV